MFIGDIISFKNQVHEPLKIELLITSDSLLKNITLACNLD